MAQKRLTGRNFLSACCPSWIASITGPGPSSWGLASPKAQLKLHYQQEFLVYVRDFPVLLARGTRQNHRRTSGACCGEYLRGDTGGLSFGRSHPELFNEMMQGLGFRNGCSAPPSCSPPAPATGSGWNRSRPAGTGWSVPRHSQSSSRQHQRSPGIQDPSSRKVRRRLKPISTPSPHPAPQHCPAVHGPHPCPSTGGGRAPPGCLCHGGRLCRYQTPTECRPCLCVLRIDALDGLPGQHRQSLQAGQTMTISRRWYGAGIVALPCPLHTTGEMVRAAGTP